ncbi:hypothetical protein [Manganibacter manganicus]|nr:hypothetical protein [Pseudaminobacter manganicus]
MTVCVCVKVNECMVFASDSATSMDGSGKLDQDGNPIQQVYRYGNKLFQIHRTHPIMAMTCGIGNFGKASIATLAKEFRSMISDTGETPLGPGYKMSTVAEMAHDFFIENRFKKANEAADGAITGGFELWIGGYSDGEETPELWKISVFKGVPNQPILVANSDTAGVWCGGQPDPILRLINGFGWRLDSILKENDITPESHPKLYANLPAALHLPLAHPLMPIQDAIDLADFLADMTKKVFRFRAVPEYVSGDIDIATVTRFERFRWIRRKHYYPPQLNQETDHV